MSITDNSMLADGAPSITPLSHIPLDKQVRIVDVQRRWLEQGKSYQIGDRLTFSLPPGGTMLIPDSVFHNVEALKPRIGRGSSYRVFAYLNFTTDGDTGRNLDRMWPHDVNFTISQWKRYVGDFEWITTDNAWKESINVGQDMHIFTDLKIKDDSVVEASSTDPATNEL